MDIAYLDFSKFFDIVSCHILIDIMIKCRLDNQAVRWIATWLNCQAQRYVISIVNSNNRLVFNGVLSGLILKPTLFDLVVNDSAGGMEYTLRKFVEDTELGGPADLVCYAAVQRDLKKMGKDIQDIHNNVMNFNKGNCKVMHPRNNPRHEFMEANWLKTSFFLVEEDLGVLVDTLNLT